MITSNKTYRRILLVLTAILFGCWSFTQAIESTDNDTDLPIPFTDSIGDSLFIELHVTPDGTHGVTTDGKQVEYDPTTGEFESVDESQTTRVIFGISPRVPDLEDVPDLDIYELEELEELVREQEAQAELLDLEARRISGLKLGTVIVEEDDVVKGPLVAVGKVIVRGIVEGDVISYKRITVTSTGVVTGDATAPDIIKMRGGLIEGNSNETGLPSIPEFDIFPTEGSDVPIIANMSIFAGLLLIGLLVLSISSKAVERVKTCISVSYVRSFFVGLLFWFAIGPLIALLALTIIGIPVAVFVLPLATAGGAVLGVFGLSLLIGEKVADKMGKSDSGRVKKFIYGLFVLESTWLIMSLLMMSASDVNQGFATFFMVLSIVVWSIGSTTGIGASILTRFGTRECEASFKVEIHAKSAPPPPTPPPLKTDEEPT